MPPLRKTADTVHIPNYLVAIYVAVWPPNAILRLVFMTGSNRKNADNLLCPVIHYILTWKRMYFHASGLLRDASVLFSWCMHASRRQILSFLPHTPERGCTDQSGLHPLDP